jgi:hypothetical protein
LAISDYDGDGRSDIGVVNSSGGQLLWFVITPNGSVLINGAPFGMTGDTITVGDYTGDGKADLSVWQSATGTFVYRSTESGADLQRGFGTSGDVPTARANQYPLP